jgi:predicted transposase/invertase (TIGR01784 family)
MKLQADRKRFISILSDYGFKVTFGNESDTRFLRKALQALINSPVAIETIEFAQNEIRGLTLDSRGGVYDLFCTDEAGNNFIVEMQLGEYPEFIQRMKFYALYRLNTLILKGDYKFKGLPKIYCIGILAVSIFPHIADYHNIATLQNESGELIDDQITFITVELDKFKKDLSQTRTDLDKLIYTMKTIDTGIEPIQYPTFWTEEWLAVAIKELDTRAMSPEERMIYEMTIATNRIAVDNEQRKIQEAVEAAEKILKTEIIIKSLKYGKLTVEEIAEISNASVDFVLEIKQNLSES